jgi:hypothetical protein
MGAKDHREQAGQGSVPIAIVTVSDTRTPATDESGQLIRTLAEAAGHTVVDYRIVKDEPDQVLAALERLQRRAGAADHLQRRHRHRSPRPHLRRDQQGAGEDRCPALARFFAC